MTPNPLLNKLGYANDDRLVILHADDIGMCHSSLQAFEDLWDFGGVSSGAVMVPCPWFPAAAEFCRRHPEVDMGVHVTLNAEWDAYRWGPLSTRDPRSGLLDSEGCLPQEPEAIYEHAAPAAVLAELEAQVERAFGAGIPVTHIDSHMGTVLHPKFARDYLQAARRRGLPALFPRPGAGGFWMLGFSEANQTVYTPIQQELEEQGLPMLDNLAVLPLEHDQDHLGLTKQMLAGLPAGITYFVFHPSVDTPELRALAPDWKARVANYQAFMSRELRAFIKNSGIQVIGWREIKETLG